MIIIWIINELLWDCEVFANLERHYHAHSYGQLLFIVPCLLFFLLLLLCSHHCLPFVDEASRLLPDLPSLVAQSIDSLPHASLLQVTDCDIEVVQFVKNQVSRRCARPLTCPSHHADKGGANNLNNFFTSHRKKWTNFGENSEELRKDIISRIPGFERGSYIVSVLHVSI
ncbi:hypothetical protein E2C01_039152 [Portunus trituberculatus]|uniref:Uncharacterized protein n=1 Tax=Portunus trituberculatus TaxID=210409 RepID=A0A5B7FLZ7_PORTR|nr:hypothetical protein [Portunus trituberculatus]